tara:strand:+ start:407 stop:1012 length:606 start_codon:yes stop_codon:yes gene_type:complete
MGDNVFDWPTVLSESDPIWIYICLFISALLENLIPPVPGDTVVIFSAYLVATEKLMLWPVFFTTIMGGEVGFMLMYFLGLRYGRDLFETQLASFIPKEKLVKAESWLLSYGGWLVVGNRFLPGVRSIISICSGIAKLNWVFVSLCGLLSLLIWNGMLFYFGFVLGKNWSSVVEVVGNYSKTVMVFICVCMTIVFWRMRQKS